MYMNITAISSSYDKKFSNIEIYFLRNTIGDAKLIKANGGKRTDILDILQLENRGAIEIFAWD